MKKIWKLPLMILLFLFLFSGCSGKDELVGIYMPKDSTAGNETIILYKDGTCHYLGDAHATWTASEDSVVITTYTSAEYYLSINLDEKMTDAEKKAIGTRINMVEAVLSSEYLAGEDSLYWVRIDKEENLKQAQNVISVISGVKSIELDVKEAKAHDHELKVVDNCLVTVGGFVYIRQGE